MAATSHKLCQLLHCSDFLNRWPTFDNGCTSRKEDVGFKDAVDLADVKYWPVVEPVVDQELVCIEQGLSGGHVPPGSG